MFEQYKPKKSPNILATKYKQGMESGCLCGKYISYNECYEEVICDNCLNNCRHKIPYIQNDNYCKCVIYDTDCYIYKSVNNDRYHYCNRISFENTYEKV